MNDIIKHSEILLARGDMKSEMERKLFCEKMIQIRYKYISIAYEKESDKPL